LTIHHERIFRDPHLAPTVILRIECEHTRRTNDDMVDVATSFTDRNGVEYPPSIAKPSKAFRHLLFAICADPPGTLITVHTQNSGDQGLYGRRLSARQCFLPGGLSGAVGCQVSPKRLVARLVRPIDVHLPSLTDRTFDLEHA
jgi:hypothetical protein